MFDQKNRLNAFLSSESFDRLVNDEKALELKAYLKNKLLDALDENNISIAYDRLSQLIRLNPIDRETIYLGLYLAINVGDKETLYVYKELVRLYWPNDQDLNGLISQI